jgi:hypothetical protein
MAHGREEEAVEFLVKYHGNNNPQSRLVLLELEEMREGIRLEGIDKNFWDCRFPTGLNAPPRNCRLTLS